MNGSKAPLSQVSVNFGQHAVNMLADWPVTSRFVPKLIVGVMKTKTPNTKTWPPYRISEAIYSLKEEADRRWRCQQMATTWSCTKQAAFNFQHQLIPQVLPHNFPLLCMMNCRGDFTENWERLRNYTRLAHHEETIHLATFRSALDRECLQSSPASVWTTCSICIQNSL